jgi:hypothetical protein
VSSHPLPDETDKAQLFGHMKGSLIIITCDPNLTLTGADKVGRDGFFGPAFLLPFLLDHAYQRMPKTHSDLRGMRIEDAELVVLAARRLRTLVDESRASPVTLLAEKMSESSRVHKGVRLRELSLCLGVEAAYQSGSPLRRRAIQ